MSKLGNSFNSQSEIDAAVKQSAIIFVRDCQSLLPTLRANASLGLLDIQVDGSVGLHFLSQISHETATSLGISLTIATNI